MIMIIIGDSNSDSESNSNSNSEQTHPCFHQRDTRRDWHRCSHHQGIWGQGLHMVFHHCEMLWNCSKAANMNKWIIVVVCVCVCEYAYMRVFVCVCACWCMCRMQLWFEWEDERESHTNNQVDSNKDTSKGHSQFSSFDFTLKKLCTSMSTLC